MLEEEDEDDEDSDPLVCSPASIGSHRTPGPLEIVIFFFTCRDVDVGHKTLQNVNFYGGT